MFQHCVTDSTYDAASLTLLLLTQGALLTLFAHPAVPDYGLRKTSMSRSQSIARKRDTHTRVSVIREEQHSRMSMLGEEEEEFMGLPSCNCLIAE